MHTHRVKPLEAHPISGLPIISKPNFRKDPKLSFSSKPLCMLCEAANSFLEVVTGDPDERKVTETRCNHPPSTRLHSFMRLALPRAGLLRPGSTSQTESARPTERTLLTHSLQLDRAGDFAHSGFLHSSQPCCMVGRPAMTIQFKK